MNIFEQEYKFLSSTIQESCKCYIEGWGMAAAGVVALGSVAAAGISSGAFTGGSGAGGASSGAVSDWQKKMQSALDNITLGDAPAPVPGLQWTPTNYNVKQLTQGTKKTPYSTVQKSGWQPLFQRDKNGNVLYKDGKPLVNKNSDGKTIFVDPKILNFKTGEGGAVLKDSSGHPVVDINAKPNLKDAGYGQEVTKGNKDLYGSPLSQVPYESTVDQSRLNTDPNKGVQQLADMTGFQGNLSQQAQQETEFQKQQRESIAPGSTQMMQQGGSVINDWLQGKVPQDVTQSIQSAAVSQFGGSYNPFTSAPGGVGQTSDVAMLKNLGLTSTQLQQAGVSAAQSWQQLADQLTTKIGDVYGRASNQNQQQYAYDVFATNTALEQDQRNYQANMTNNIIRHSPDPRATGYLNDFLKLNGLNDQNALTKALNDQQTSLLNTQLQQQFQTNSANLDLAKVQAGMGLAPTQLPQSNVNGQMLGAGIQASLPIIQALMAGAGGTAGSSGGTFPNANQWAGQYWNSPVTSGSNYFSS